MYARLLILLLLTTSCCPKTDLSVFTEYISVETLPSYRLDTPDPRLCNPDIGEKLHISWSTPGTYTSLTLKLYLQFGNRTQITEEYDLSCPSGLMIYPFLNDAYWEKQGILAFKLELYGDDELLKVWLHQLYTERIELEE